MKLLKLILELSARLTLYAILFAAILYVTGFTCLSDNRETGSQCIAIIYPTVILTGFTFSAYHTYLAIRRYKRPLVLRGDNDDERRLKDIHTLGYGICIISVLLWFIFGVMVGPPFGVMFIIPGITLGIVLINYKKS